MVFLVAKQKKTIENDVIQSYEIPLRIVVGMRNERSKSIGEFNGTLTSILYG